MKMQDEHYNYIKTAMAAIAYAIPEHGKTVIASGNYKDIDKSIRWSWYYGAVPLPCKYTRDKLYSYLNDDDIDKALQSIVKELEGASNA